MPPALRNVRKGWVANQWDPDTPFCSSNATWDGTMQWKSAWPLCYNLAAQGEAELTAHASRA